MKKIGMILISLFCFFFCWCIVNANNIRGIDIDIYIDEYGNAIVNEVWSAYLNEGTEGFRSFSKLGNSSISDFTLYDDKGVNYTYQNNWDTSLSFNEKAFKNGINYTYNGLELCWGISEYGERKYYLSYKINNFVSQYKDKQGIYFNLLNLDQSVSKVKVKVSSYIPLNLDNSKIWGFGYDGDVVFQDNSIIMNSGYLASYQYMVLLVRFEDDYYQTNNNVNKTFDNIYDEAFEDDDHKENGAIFELLLYLFIIIFIQWGIPIIIIVYIFSKVTRYINKYEGGRHLKSINKVDYYRELPCDKDLINIYYIMSIYFKEDKQELQKRLVSSLIMKWVLENRIVYKDKNLYINDKSLNVFKTGKVVKNYNSEEEMFDMIAKASGDLCLEKNEFKKWCKRNYNRLIYWFNSIDNLGKSYYYARHYIEYEHKEKRILFGKKNIYYTIYKSALKDEAYRLLGFKKFLLDFGRMNEKTTIEVELWNYYLIIANMLGISDRVINELKVFYPEVNLDISYIDDIINDGYKSMELGKKQHDREEARRNRDYSGSDSFSGGGGSSFSSGGSSAGGSSGGGFR